MELSLIILNVVVFDILFNESEVGRLDINGITSENDFAKAIKKYENIILASMVDSNKNFNDNELLKWHNNFENSNKFPFEESYNSMILPIKILRENTGHIGIAKYHNDIDGICRRLLLNL